MKKVKKIDYSYLFAAFTCYSCLAYMILMALGLLAIVVFAAAYFFGLAT